MLHWKRPASSAAALLPPPPLLRRFQTRTFRSEAALDALLSHLRAGLPNPSLVLYNYPSFSGAFAALFAKLFHSVLELPFLALPFSSVEPLRLEDFGAARGLETCYLLDFIGPRTFAIELSRIVERVVVFDHRKSSLDRVSQLKEVPKNLEFHIDTNKCSAISVHDYFLGKLMESKTPSEEPVFILNPEDRERVAKVLRYIEDADLRRWELPGIKAFNDGLREERAKLNCVTNPYVFEQLLEIDSDNLIARGIAYVNSRKNAANKLVEKAFKIQLGRGLYGECLAIRADGNSDLSHEIGLELSRRSAAAGLKPIGAVVFMQRRNLKMCLRSTDSATDTSEIAKAYGGGGNRSSSSFIIRMDEYNEWTAVNSSRAT